jgi:hypothetical protein
MAKTSGVGWTTLNVDLSDGTTVTDIRNDVTNLQFATPRAVTDVTGIDKSAIERLLLLADFSITLNGQWNSTGVHLVLKTVPSTSVARTTTLGVAGVSLPNEVLYTDYAITRDAGGDLNWSSPGVLANGVVPVWA